MRLTRHCHFVTRSYYPPVELIPNFRLLGWLQMSIRRSADGARTPNLTARGRMCSPPGHDSTVEAVCPSIHHLFCTAPGSRLFPSYQTVGLSEHPNHQWWIYLKILEWEPNESPTYRSGALETKRAIISELPITLMSILIFFRGPHGSHYCQVCAAVLETHGSIPQHRPLDPSVNHPKQAPRSPIFLTDKFP